MSGQAARQLDPPLSSQLYVCPALLARQPNFNLFHKPAAFRASLTAQRGRKRINYYAVKGERRRPYIGLELTKRWKTLRPLRPLILFQKTLINIINRDHDCRILCNPQISERSPFARTIRGPAHRYLNHLLRLVHRNRKRTTSSRIFQTAKSSTRLALHQRTRRLRPCRFHRHHHRD